MMFGLLCIMVACMATAKFTADAFSAHPLSEFHRPQNYGADVTSKNASYSSSASSASQPSLPQPFIGAPESSAAAAAAAVPDRTFPQDFLSSSQAVSRSHGTGAATLTSKQANFDDQSPATAVFNALRSDGTHAFGYETPDGQSRSETTLPDGTKQGSYAYRTPDGHLVAINYSAGRRGFVTSAGSALASAHTTSKVNFSEGNLRDNSDGRAQQLAGFWQTNNRPAASSAGDSQVLRHDITNPFVNSPRNDPFFSGQGRHLATTSASERTSQFGNLGGSGHFSSSSSSAGESGHFTGLKQHFPSSSFVHRFSAASASNTFPKPNNGSPFTSAPVNHHFPPRNELFLNSAGNIPFNVVGRNPAANGPFATANRNWNSDASEASSYGIDNNSNVNNDSHSNTAGPNGSNNVFVSFGAKYDTNGSRNFVMSHGSESASTENIHKSSVQSNFIDGSRASSPSGLPSTSVSTVEQVTSLSIPAPPPPLFMYGNSPANQVGFFPLNTLFIPTLEASSSSVTEHSSAGDQQQEIGAASHAEASKTISVPYEYSYGSNPQAVQHLQQMLG